MSEYVVGLSFFDSRVSINDKKRMVLALQKSSTGQAAKRIDIKKSTVLQKVQSDLITEKSKNIFLANNVSVETSKTVPVM